MIFRADFDDVIEGYTIIELNKLEWVQKLQSANRFDILFAYPMLDMPQIGERCKVFKNSNLIFEGHVSSVDDRNLTLTATEGYTMKFQIDCFTSESVGTKFPENTYEVDSLEGLNRIVHNCTRAIAGIRQIQIWVDQPHPFPAVETESGRT